MSEEQQDIKRKAAQKAKLQCGTRTKAPMKSQAASPASRGHRAAQAGLGSRLNLAEHGGVSVD